MDFIFYLLFVAVLLLVFSPTLRAWLLARFLGWIQKRLLRQMQERQGYRSPNGERQRYHQGRQEENKTEAHATQGKLAMDDIATKKFDKAQKEDYVDFEELPK